MNQLRILIVFMIVLMTSCQKNDNLIETLMRKSGKMDEVLSNAEKYKVQIIYTQINRDGSNKPVFTTHRFRVDSSRYFYPASTIKLPMAALALEKVNDLNLLGLNSFSKMQIDSAFSGQTSVTEDTSAASGYPSLAHYIKKVFLISDNDAFNRLYEFVGQNEANMRMLDKGYEDTRITHRLSIPLSLQENRCTNPMSFYAGDTVVYRQPMQCNGHQFSSDTPLFIGKQYVGDGVLINKPMEFTHKNAIGLQSLHDVLLSIIFPNETPQNNRFNLTERDYRFLYEVMSGYPRESDFLDYDGYYADNYCKFLMFAGPDQTIEPHIRIFNKVGQAYGFLLDMAYIVDFERQIEFALGAVIYTNENEVLNDGVYEYESVGYPFMRELGQIFYAYEKQRKRVHQPDLSRYNWKAWQD
jgi:hypothetical protein